MFVTINAFTVHYYDTWITVFLANCLWWWQEFCNLRHLPPSVWKLVLFIILPDESESVLRLLYKVGHRALSLSPVSHQNKQGVMSRKWTCFINAQWFFGFDFSMEKLLLYACTLWKCFLFRDLGFYRKIYLIVRRCLSQRKS